MRRRFLWLMDVRRTFCPNHFQLAKATLPGVQLALLVAATVFAFSWSLSQGHATPRLIIEVASAALVCFLYSIWGLPAQVAPLVLRLVDSTGQVVRFSWMDWYQKRIVASKTAFTPTGL
jgi:hypothetical protein